MNREEGIIAGREEGAVESGIKEEGIIVGREVLMIFVVLVVVLTVEAGVGVRRLAMMLVPVSADALAITVGAASKFKVDSLPKDVESCDEEETNFEEVEAEEVIVFCPKVCEGVQISTKSTSRRSERRK